MAMRDFARKVLTAAALCGLGMVVLIFAIDTVLTMDLPTTRDFSKFAILGAATFVLVGLLVPVLAWLERKYPEHFRRDKE